MQTSRIERSVVDMQAVVVIPSMQGSLRDFEHYCRDRRHLRPWSINARIREVTLFMHYLATKRQISHLEQIQSKDLSAFVISCKHYRPKTVSGIVSSIRQLVKFLMMRGILQQDLAATLPTIRVPRDAQVPSVWDTEQITQLLDVVDRSSPRGKRDYAILLLACRLGLRLGDIRTLTLDNINWDEATLEIIQAKTQTPLCLPMTVEVGEALIDYLRSGRPETPCREVFIQARQPFMPFSENNRLHHIVTHWRGLAGIQFRQAQRHGLHSLRHSLATQLLQQGTPIHVIADILGHTTVDSTMIYAKADLEALRGAALPIEEVSDDQ
ncbi:MAG: site-specific integrase [Pseudomonadota bacterium]|nr:site-specific integrase [Pseudomonadota bacterium]